MAYRQARRTGYGEGGAYATGGGEPSMGLAPPVASPFNPAFPPATTDPWERNVEQSLTSYGRRAYELEGEENRRGAAEESLLKDAAAKANVPTLTEEMIRRQFAARADTAAGSFLDRMSSLREYMGDSGVTGGFTAGIAANAQTEYLRALTTTRGDLLATKATQDALDRQKEFDRSQVVGRSVNRPVSMLGVDFENQRLATRLTQLGVQRDYEATLYSAQQQREAAEAASEDSLWAAIIGGAGTALGAVL